MYRFKAFSPSMVAVIQRSLRSSETCEGNRRVRKKIKRTGCQDILIVLATYEPVTVHTNVSMEHPRSEPIHPYQSSLLHLRASHPSPSRLSATSSLLNMPQLKLRPPPDQNPNIPLEDLRLTGRIEMLHPSPASRDYKPHIPIPFLRPPRRKPHLSRTDASLHTVSETVFETRKVLLNGLFEL
jgi:hypothetical protein